MNFRTIKLVAAIGATLMGITALSTTANAQTETLTATLATNSAITTAPVSDLDFGTWFLVHRNADDFTLTMATDGTIAAGGLGGGALDSQAIELVNVEQEGEITVDLPAGANGVVLQMIRTAIADFPDAGLSFGSTTYETATEGANQAFDDATPVDVTVVTGGTPESITFGGQITVTATPDDLNSPHVASFDVTLSY